ncbi:MAG: AI-2E family transporter [Gammaproteobacteria bacterium]|nr:MAG: AI-2E family transporter [Gammaproteobacteria bacterium]RLA13485.1 MAG: AI-2E family transporter [Gammaproteobacteria bacterium]RLA14466.1 MAG: AI-2E family transporter [Gammaproteobacteria bacterium]
MDQLDSHNSQSSVRQSIEIAVTLGLIAVVLSWGFLILKPFISVIVSGGVIAIAIYPLVLKLQGMLGGSKKLATMLVTVLALTMIIVPTWMFAGSMIESGASLGKDIAEGTVHIPPPSESVKEWPVVGKTIHASWALAAQNSTAWLQTNASMVKAVGETILGKIAGAGIGMLLLVVSILIAALFISSAEANTAGLQRFSRRLMGKKGDDVLGLSVATIRSVAMGVLGIAIIQAVLGGIGMIAVGVPGAGLLALLVLMVAIAQLPPWLILGPVIFYVFSVESSTVAIIFMVWSIIVSFLDMFLKPLLLGRGVDAPMLVILLGAIGGMVMSGIIGLFVGAVVLALAYKLVQAWLAAGETDSDAAAVDAPPAQ